MSFKIDSVVPRHPLGTQAKVLLSSVFGPFAQDDEFGSRKVNPMELYHNQVTRTQGPFSLRFFHPSFGLMMLQANIDAPCVMLDFPTLEEFVAQLKAIAYDIIGISAIATNIGKVKRMAEEVRRIRPDATLVIGGHIANVPDLVQSVDADLVVRGEGVSWFRRFLGQREDLPIRHPVVDVRFGGRTMGIPMGRKSNEPVAAVVPSVGCPIGCNFCSTSAMFGGKGKSVDFYETGEELFSILDQIDRKIGARSFFVFDENFLLHRKRALRLLELIEEHQKSWSFYAFSSARVLESYTMDQLVRLGLSWVWMGLEGKESRYSKLGGVDTHKLVRKLQSHGIGVLGSSIIGMENHTCEDIQEVIDWAISHDSDFHQFMLYTPLPGTPLYAEHTQQGTLLSEEECPLADAHGQERFNFQHPHIRNGEETEYLIQAFEKDFEVNGPSIARTIRTRLMGWRKYKDHPDERIRKRLEKDIASVKTAYAAALFAMKKWYKNDERMSDKISNLLREFYREFGWSTRISTPILGRVVYSAIRREAKRLAEGWTYEPALRLLRNATAASLLEGTDIQEGTEVVELEWVTCKTSLSR